VEHKEEHMSKASNMPETSGKSTPEAIGELWELTKDYARQETTDPLKGIGRYLLFGLAGAVLLSTGVVLLLVSLLRVLQTQTDTTFTGSWSWAPYVIVLAVGAVFVLLAISRIATK
jgi:hypothetical protein